MKHVIISLLFIGCVNDASFEFDNSKQVYGYIANENINPVLFHDVENDSLIFIYEYNTFNKQEVRENRTILYYQEENRNIFIGAKK